jgi:LL-diaminopimelate aminotransferase
MPEISDRIKKLPPYVFAVIGQKVREMQQNGIDVIRMDIGSPDLAPADFVLDKLNESAHNPKNHGYSGYRGTPGFREAVARYYDKRFGVSIDPEKEVLPLIGSKEGIVNFALAYLDHGDVALVPGIGYPSYAMGTLLAGAEVYYVPMPPEKDFLLDISGIPADIRQKAKLLWTNYPNNPTGAIADLSFYEEMLSFCAENDIILASDNPYCDVTFGDYRAPSALQVDGAKDHTVEFISMSKTFNMAGWRLGAAVGSAEALKHLLTVKSNVDSGHFIPAYDAGIIAMEQTTDEWLAERNKIYQARRDVILAGLSEIGLEADVPKASLYVWARVKDMPVMEYVERVRNEAYVSIAPGDAYGPGGEGFVRMSLCTSVERLEEGIERLKKWYKSK